MQQHDTDIIAMVLNGQKDAYSILVQRYQQYVFTLALRYVNNNREDAEELAQDVFIKAYRFLGDFRQNSKFSTWLYTIVHTTAISHLRKRKSGEVFIDEEKLVYLSDNKTQGLLYNAAEKRSVNEQLNIAIAQLGEDEARVIYLFYQAEQSIEEIGLIMNISTNLVKVKLFRARQKLKGILTQQLTHELKDL
ncbi:MAG: sigma-70 family RNA polymerase sigma factor [Sphingobacteriales bacterium]|nr:MAG: sigma-70 family RNA polymerase sigma factor [Sphingobacteriales bacterium]